MSSLLKYLLIYSHFLIGLLLVVAVAEFGDILYISDISVLHDYCVKISSPIQWKSLFQPELLLLYKAF